MNARISTQARSLLRNALLGSVAACAIVGAANAQQPVGTAGERVDNTAVSDYRLAAGLDPIQLPSNTVSFEVDFPPTPAVIDILRVDIANANPNSPNLDVSGTQCADPSGALVAPPIPSGFDPFSPADQVTDLATTDTITTDSVNSGAPVFLQLTDQNRNTDSRTRETVLVTVTASDAARPGSPAWDEETVELVETGPDTGVFAGYLQTVARNAQPVARFNCVLSVEPNTSLAARYQDVDYPTDIATDSILIDPFGIVFDSRTGAPIDGATVSLFVLDAAGNRVPADVFGDPVGGNPPQGGFPNVQTTGQTINFNGVDYVMPPGGFRFPLVEPNRDYVIVVEADGFTFVSVVPAQTLIDAFQGVYTIDPEGSFNQPFPVPIGPAVNLDIPVDPAPLRLTLDKIASRNQASIGDYVQYRLTLENVSQDALEASTIQDVLPPGFRYQDNSARLSDSVAGTTNAPVADGVITVAQDGRELTFNIGVIQPGQTLIYSYVTVITAGAGQGRADNIATATSTFVTPPIAGTPVDLPDLTIASNEARASVQVRNDFFTDAMTIIGRVVEGQCNTPAEELVGVEGIRLMLEDGTYITTDRDGHYHFRGVRPGTHVVQVDVDTVPLHMEMIPCIRNSRHGGRTHSRFVDGRGGSLWREDFYLRPLPPLAQIQAPVGIRLQTIGQPAPELFSFVGNFGVLKAELTPQDVAELEKIAQQLEGRNIDFVEVTGHTSSVRVAPEHRHIFANNFELSKARARSAAVWLAGRLRLRPEIFSIDGLGPSVPVASNDTAEGRARNRRVEVRVRASTPMRYRATMDAGDVAARDAKIMLMAPDGVELDAATATLNGVPLPAARVSGTVATFPLGETGSNWQNVVEITGHAPSSFTTNRIFRAQFDTRKDVLKPEGEAAIKALIDSLSGKNITHIRVTGHTDSIRIAPQHRHEFANNQVLSEARARTVANRLQAALGLAPNQITVGGEGPNRPVADNSTPEGRALNRRVELRITENTGGSACANNEALTAKAVGMFDTDVQSGQRTAVVENEHRCSPAQPRRREFGFVPHFDTMKATIRFEDKPGLNQIASELATHEVQTLTTIGHTDARVIDGPVRRAEYDNNQVLSLARSKAVNDYIGDQIGLTAQQKVIRGAAATVPVAPNTTQEQMALNRRVSVEAFSADPAERALAVTVPDSGRKQTDVIGDAEDIRPHMVSGRQNLKPRNFALPEEPVKLLDRDFTTGIQPGRRFVYPVTDESPRIPATYIAISHGPQETVDLKVNGVPVHPLTFQGVQRSADGKTAVSVWRAIKIDFGPNPINADILSANGDVVESLESNVHYATGPTRAELLPEESTLIADGVTNPVLAFRLYDRFDKPVGPYSIGNFGLNAPYESQDQIDAQNERSIAGAENFAPRYRVEKDGVTYIELAPTTQSGNVVVSFQFENDRVEEERVWLEAGQRDWVMVGFVEGTIGYNKLEGNMQGLQAAEAEEDVYTDGEAAFYAKGTVLGKWLLTAAYDTRRARESDITGRLNGTIDPNEYYTLYGDSALQRHDAASVEKLYLRIERPRFYALFGDYTTGLTVTELSRYTRTVTGIKSEYAGDHLSYNLFAAETDHGFIRDEFAADGTSGPYQLSRPDLLINSEVIYIERRDRFTGIPFAEREQLRRHTDYDIDYVNGTLFFRTPQLSRDNEFNPRFIVAEYEIVSGQEEALNAGGRVEMKFGGTGGDALRFGLSAVRDDTGQTKTNLYGLDARLRFSTRTELLLEAATSDTESLTGTGTGTTAGESSGDALLARLRHRGEVIGAELYFTQQDEGFGVGQQAQSSAGTRKYGIDTLFKLTERLGVRLAADHSEATGTDSSNERDHAVAELRYQRISGGVSLGVQHTRDRLEDGDRESTQIVAGANKAFLDNRLRLEGRVESSLSGSASENDQSVDYPKRYLVGLSYRLTESTDVFVQHEITDGSTFDGSITRAGMRTTPWANAVLTSSVDQTITENGPRTFGTMGLRQGLVLDDNWSADISLDRSQTIREPGAPEPIQDGQTVSSAPIATPAVGGVGADFTAVSTGLTYLSEHWSWNGRLEGRYTDADDRYGLTTGFIRQIEAGKAFSAQMQVFDLQSKLTDSRTTSADATLSWAHRPLTQNWSILDRLDLEYDRTQADGSEIRNAKIVNNFVVNWVSGIGDDFDEDRAWDFMLDRVQSWQWSLYYGTKYVVSTFDDQQFDNFAHVLGAEARFDLTQWLDVGYHYTLLHSVPMQGNFFDSFRDGQLAYSFGPSIGISPINNLWLSLGYNLSGFEDDDFEAANYYQHGPYLKLRFKFDQLTGLNRDGRHHKLAGWRDEDADEEFWRPGRNMDDERDQLSRAYGDAYDDGSTRVASGGAGE